MTSPVGLPQGVPNPLDPAVPPAAGWQYVPGFADPGFAGLVEYGGVRIGRGGSFVMVDLSGLLAVPAARVTVTPQGGTDGATLSRALYEPRSFDLRFAVRVPTAYQVPQALDYLRRWFSLLGENSRLVVAHRDWPQRRALTARCLEGLELEEPEVRRKAVPQRFVTAHMLAADPRLVHADVENVVTASLTPDPGQVARVVRAANAGTYLADLRLRFRGAFDRVTVSAGVGQSLTFGPLAAGETAELDAYARTVTITTAEGTSNGYGRMRGPWTLRHARPGGTDLTVSANPGAAGDVTVRTRDTWV